MRYRPLLFILAGLALVTWAALRAAGELLPSFLPTPTPAEQVLETFGPGQGPLGRPTSGSGEVESRPVAATLAPPPPDPTAAALPAGATALPAGTGEAGPEGSFLGERVSAVMDAPTPTPTLTPAAPAIPDRIVIPAISLDAPVLFATSQRIRLGGNDYYQWVAPDTFAAGWHTNSAYLGQPGNTVLSGHHNILGKVFERLVDLNQGDVIQVLSGERVFNYMVSNKMILPEKTVSVEQRLENARWISHSDDERLTLITCWPADNNTHRLIIVAAPVPEP